MRIKNMTFLDLIPFSFAMEMYIKTPEQLRKVFVAGIRKDVLFYTINQSDKCVQMVRWGERETEDGRFSGRFHEAEKLLIVTRGQALPIQHVDQFDKLYKRSLNEIDLFVDIEGFHEPIEFQMSEYLFEMHAQRGTLTRPSDFETINLENVFVRNSDLDTIARVASGEAENKESKQTRRENVFIKWLQGKDHQVVSNMKKDDVWEELRKLDRMLFGVESKNFFRDQKIITFKSGRKPN